MLTKACLSVALVAANLAAAVPVGPRWSKSLLGLETETGKKRLTFDDNGNFKVRTVYLEHMCKSNRAVALEGHQLL